MPDGCYGVGDLHETEEVPASEWSWRSPYVQSRSVEERWYVGGNITGNTFTTRTTTQDEHSFIPIVFGQDGVIDLISFRVTTAVAGTTGWCGLYETDDDADGFYPGAICGFGSSASTSTGVKSHRVVIPVVGGRLYWAWYFQVGGAPVIRAMTPSGMWAFGGIDTAMGTSLGHYLSVVSASGGPISPAPAGMAWGTNVRIPAVAFRMSA